MSKSDESTASGCLAALIGILVILPLQAMTMTWVFVAYFVYYGATYFLGWLAHQNMS